MYLYILILCATTKKKSYLKLSKINSSVILKNSSHVRFAQMKYSKGIVLDKGVDV